MILDQLEYCFHEYYSKGIKNKSIHGWKRMKLMNATKTNLDNCK